MKNNVSKNNVAKKQIVRGKITSEMKSYVAHVTKCDLEQAFNALREANCNIESLQSFMEGLGWTGKVVPYVKPDSPEPAATAVRVTKSKTGIRQRADPELVGFIDELYRPFESASVKLVSLSTRLAEIGDEIAEERKHGTRAASARESAQDRLDATIEYARSKNAIGALEKSPRFNELRNTIAALEKDVVESDKKVKVLLTEMAEVEAEIRAVKVELAEASKALK